MPACIQHQHGYTYYRDVSFKGAPGEERCSPKHFHHLQISSVYSSASFNLTVSLLLQVLILMLRPLWTVVVKM